MRVHNALQISANVTVALIDTGAKFPVVTRCKASRLGRQQTFLWLASMQPETFDDWYVRSSQFFAGLKSMVTSVASFRSLACLAESILDAPVHEQLRS